MNASTIIFALAALALASSAANPTTPRAEPDWPYDEVRPSGGHTLRTGLRTGSFSGLQTAVNFCPPASFAHRKTRREALAMLRTMQILSPRTRVTSIVWRRKKHEWFITLLHPAGGHTYWHVGAHSTSLEGGTEARL